MASITFELNGKNQTIDVTQSSILQVSESENFQLI